MSESAPHGAEGDAMNGRLTNAESARWHQVWYRLEGRYDQGYAAHKADEAVMVMRRRKARTAQKGPTK